MTDMAAQFSYPTRTFLTRKERLAMPAVLSALQSEASLPLLVTLGIATVLLALLAIYVRRLRFTGRLRPINGSISAVCAGLVVAAALVISVGLGNAPAATAAPTVDPAPSVVEPAPGAEVPAGQVPASDELDGYQLPTL